MCAEDCRLASDEYADFNNASSISYAILKQYTVPHALYEHVLSQDPPDLACGA